MLQDIEVFRAYIFHMMSEHRHLHETLQTIEQKWRVVDMQAALDASMDELWTSVKRLRDELQQHFIEEESGGCIEEAVARCPSLSQRAAQIEHEHVSLLEQLDRIIAELQRVCTDSSVVDASRTEFESFVQQLRAHEAADDEILQRAFGIE